MSEEKRDIYFKIYRYNPEVDQHPYYDEIKISVERGITVLRALNYIKDHIESKLSYRFFCQAGICGSCAIRINGVSKLACTTQVWDELKKCKEPDVIVVEPLNNLTPVRDLVIDYNPVVDKLIKYKGWVEPKDAPEGFGKKEFSIAEKDFKVIDPATDCILCAACYSECSIVSSNNEFVSPLVMLKAFRMNRDERDTVTRERLAVLNQDHGMWDCTHCYRCVEACVKNIPIMDAIHGVRNDAFRLGMSHTEGYKHAKVFMTDISDYGRLKEATVPLRTRGMFAMVGQLPFMIKLLLARRTPPILMHKIPGLKKVRALMKRTGKKK